MCAALLCTARLAVIVPFAALLCVPPQACASTITLGSAANFAVLGGSAVTNTGSTTLNGDLGVYPGSSITGAASITFIGASTNEGNNAVSQLAQMDATTAYNALAAQTPTMDLTGQTLGSGGTLGTLDPGVYKFDSSAQLNGTLTLDAENLSSAVFIFQIGSTLTTASASSVDVINAGNTNGNVQVFWEIGSSATLGTTTDFAGNILAEASIRLNTGAEILCGRALAQTGAVTMDTNTVSNNCTTYNADTGRSDFGSAGFSGGNGVEATIPEPGTIALLSIGLMGLVAASFRPGVRKAFCIRRASGIFTTR